MASRLCDDDGRAVDLLLNHGSVNGNGGCVPIGFTAAPAAVRDRITRAARLLDLLREYPVGDVPADLVENTMRRIDSAPRRATPPGGPADSPETRPSV